ncbi:hypothetical protein [Singulisphaera sp. PoT]|uniref:hypothetical protein n=1 Tax=Singulisphaera sp. PoT TaxID=3411797 RepID=UPI003BF4AB4E
MAVTSAEGIATEAGSQSELTPTRPKVEPRPLRVSWIRRRSRARESRPLKVVGDQLRRRAASSYVSPWR